MIAVPFLPTECACEQDKQNCQRQPGHLLPGQLTEILDTLGVERSEAGRYFWNSPGMVLGDSKTGQTFRIRTITPRFENGACVFFANGRCGIHAVAPFGCRYFDIHMSGAEGDRRAMWGVRRLMDALPEYEAERDALPMATHYNPRSVA